MSLSEEQSCPSIVVRLPRAQPEPTPPSDTAVSRFLLWAVDADDDEDIFDDAPTDPTIVLPHLRHWYGSPMGPTLPSEG